MEFWTEKIIGGKMKKQMKTIVLNDLYTMDMQSAERMIDALFKNKSLKDMEIKNVNLIHL